MDPFSVTAGIVGIVDGGLSIAERIKDIVSKYRQAERELIDLAHEIDLTTSLVDILGDGLDQPENAYPKKVVQQTKMLVGDVRKIFDEIRQMMDNFDFSSKSKVDYVINAGSLTKFQSKIKSIQLSFVFMLSVCPPRRRLDQTAVAAAQGPLDQLGSFEGTIEQFPVDFNTSRGDPNGGSPVVYKAVLTLRPQGPTGLPFKFPGTSSSPAPSKPSLTDTLEEARKNKKLKKKLKNLARSPFFSTDMFRSRESNSKFTRERLRAEWEESRVNLKTNESYTEAKLREEMMKKMEVETQRKRDHLSIPSNREAEKARDDVLVLVLGEDDEEPGPEDSGNEKTVRFESARVKPTPVSSQGDRLAANSEDLNPRAPHRKEDRSPRRPDHRLYPDDPTRNRRLSPLRSRVSPSRSGRRASNSFTCTGCQREYENGPRYEFSESPGLEFCDSCFRSRRRTRDYEHPKMDSKVRYSYDG